MSELEEAQKMLAEATRAEKTARENLERSVRDRLRAESMMQEAADVAGEIRKHRENNHFTATFRALFGG